MEECIEKPIGVYIKINSDNYIISIHSDIFIKDLNRWIKIDEGYGDKYALAQTHYLPKCLYDDNGKYNFKYVNGRVIDVLSIK